MTARQTRDLPFTSVLTILLCLLSLGFLFLGARGLVAPSLGAKSFGLAVADPNDLPLMQATAARNIGLALLGASLIFYDMRRALGFLLAFAAVISVLDVVIVNAASGFAIAAKHGVYFVILSGFAWVVLRKDHKTAATP